MRAGQPLTGTNGRRCKEDEKLINATLRPGKRGYIIDTRTIGAAQQAKVRGGGFELEANYPQWRKIHKAVERCVTAEAERLGVPQTLPTGLFPVGALFLKVALKDVRIPRFSSGLMSSRRA